MALPREILDVQTIYMEPAVETYDRGRQVLERYPDARRMMVPSHNQIPTLYGNEGNAEDWLRIKQHILVLNSFARSFPEAGLPGRTTASSCFSILR